MKQKNLLKVGVLAALLVLVGLAVVGCAMDVPPDELLGNWKASVTAYEFKEGEIYMSVVVPAIPGLTSETVTAGTKLCDAKYTKTQITTIIGGTKKTCKYSISGSTLTIEEGEAAGLISGAYTKY
jgi:hypothetical protein